MKDEKLCTQFGSIRSGFLATLIFDFLTLRGSLAWTRWGILVKYVAKIHKFNNLSKTVSLVKIFHRTPKKIINRGIKVGFKMKYNCYMLPIQVLKIFIGSWWGDYLRSAEEVDEAEDYEAPGSNPGQKLWNMKMCFSIKKAISNSLHGAARSGTGPHPLIRYMWEAYACNIISNGWWSNHNVGLRMLLVVGAGGGTSQASRDVNGSATHPS